MKTRTSTTPLGALIHLTQPGPASIYRSNFFKTALVVITVVLIAMAASRLIEPAAQTTSLKAPAAASPVYDASEAMRQAVMYPWEAHAAAPNMVYDATSSMQKAVMEPWEVRATTPNTVYDATAAREKSIVYPTFK